MYPSNNPLDKNYLFFNRVHQLKYGKSWNNRCDKIIPQQLENRARNRVISIEIQLQTQLETSSR